MVGIVIVSHSETLAEGLRELADQMAKGTVRIAVAGGIDDPENPFGTDAIRVYEAIQSVYGDDGVVVLMDLGSAILSAETALDMLSEEERENVRLSAAPFVEGALSAAAQAAAGSELDTVVVEAQGALHAKLSQLGVEDVSTFVQEMETETEPTHDVRLTIRNKMGLHARPAARFVATAGKFDATLRVSNATLQKGPVNAKSINQLATLEVSQDHDIVVTASGPDAEEALAALQDLVAANFGEVDTETPSVPAVPVTDEDSALAETATFVGIPASPGITVAPVTQYRRVVPEIETTTIHDPDTEVERLQQAIATARTQIETLRSRTAERAGEEEAAIFDAHALFLEDPALVDEAIDRIREERINAEAAWQDTIDELVAQYEQIEDEYLRGRAADVADVGERVVRVLTDTVPADVDLSEPAILIAPDLTPSDTAQLDTEKVLGICTARGGSTSHTAILSRAIGIPAIVGAGDGVLQIDDGTAIAIDGESGHVWVEPANEVLRQLEERQEAWKTRQAVARRTSAEPATTKEGIRVEVVANIRGPADAQTALEYGAEGVGLLRTEFLYLDRSTAPDEDEQTDVYSAIADVMEQRPLIIRTLDIGGDKPLPYVNMGNEANPFLGQRGIRLTLNNPEMLKTQLRAILRASPGHQIKIMFPMVSSVAEVQAANAILVEAQAELTEEGFEYDESLEVGIMIEVPAAVVAADQLATEVDFFSIGTNDLSQYTMAADRTNERVASLADAFHPSVLRMIQQTITAGHDAGIWVGLCGELAGEPAAVPLLLGLGLDEFSMNAPAIPIVKQIIGQLTMPEAEAIADRALTFRSAEDVRTYLAAQLDS